MKPKTSQPPTNEFLLWPDNTGKLRYQRQRIAHWDRVSEKKKQPGRIGEFYHKLLEYYYRFKIPKGLRILEIGCGHGDLLASLEPEMGVGIDFSREMIKTASAKYPNLHFLVGDAHDVCLHTQFDVIILSDLVNDLWDVQTMLENLHGMMHSGTRVVMNFYNNLWRIPLWIAKRFDLGGELLEQNWFSPDDVQNLLYLTDFEVVNRGVRILFPLRVPILSGLANKFLVHFFPFSWMAVTNFMVARSKRHQKRQAEEPVVSIIVPARNEAGNIENIIKRVPDMGKRTEIVFVEGHSTDQTFYAIEKAIPTFAERTCRLYRQRGKGKGDAVRLGFEKAAGDILIILDADLTVPPEDLPRFVEALTSGKGEFINGVRLVYPMENQSMRFLNILGNKFFSLMFTWLLGQPVKDTLCGTKVLWKSDYETLAKGRQYFGTSDPFGDFDLLFGAAKMNLKIVDMPIRYKSRTYGDTNIDRWRHGWLLLKMAILAARRLKFI